MLAVMYVTYQNRLLVVQKTNEFVQLVDEARSVKDDLEQLLDHVINVSGSIVDDLISEQQSERICHGSQILNTDLVPAMDDIAVSTIEPVKADDEPDYNNRPDLILDPVPLSPRADQSKTAPSFDLQNFHTRVKNLYQRGFTTKEIAQKLDKGQDEVSLIINLLDMQY